MNMAFDVFASYLSSTRGELETMVWSSTRALFAGLSEASSRVRGEVILGSVQQYARLQQR